MHYFWPNAVTLGEHGDQTGKYAKGETIALGCW